jgi:hypothetical protein
VPYRNGPASENKARSRITRWLGNLAAAVGSRLFAAGDTSAVQHGWQITVRRGGLSRSYRDPRFGTLRACPRCQGGGWADGAPCAPCRGMGRVGDAAARQAFYQEDQFQ